jgi:hypothetical protein
LFWGCGKRTSLLLKTNHGAPCWGLGIGEELLLGVCMTTGMSGSSSGRQPRGSKKKPDGPLRGWLVPRRLKKYQGWLDFFPRFFIVFLNSPDRETPKNVIKKNREKIGFGFFCRFLKNFSTRFLCKTFFAVFLNSHRYETPENAIKQKNRGKTDIEIFVDFLRIFLGKGFRHGLVAKIF